MTEIAAGNPRFRRMYRLVPMISAEDDSILRFKYSSTTGLVREPFISGADTILDVLAEHIPNAVDGFKIVFSARPFPGYTARFVWTRAEYEGN